MFVFEHLVENVQSLSLIFGSNFGVHLVRSFSTVVYLGLDNSLNSLLWEALVYNVCQQHPGIPPTNVPSVKLVPSKNVPKHRQMSHGTKLPPVEHH